MGIGSGSQPAKGDAGSTEDAQEAQEAQEAQKERQARTLRSDTIEDRIEHDAAGATAPAGVASPGSAAGTTSKEQELAALLAPTVQGLGCEIWGLEYRPWGRRRATLKLFIEAPGGVTIEHCERVSRQVSALLDVEDPIVSAYRLEVSSPGLDRALFSRAHYQASIGEQVDVRLALPVAGRRRVEGQLVGIEGDEVVVRDGEHEYLLPFGHILRTRIVPSFAGATAPQAAPQPAAAAGLAHAADCGVA